MQLASHDLPYLSLVQYWDNIHAVLSTPQCLKLGNGSVTVLAQLDQTAPIPITEAALKALGFEETDADEWTITTPGPPPDHPHALTSVSVKVFYDGPPIVGFHDRDLPFETLIIPDEYEYVHELQQAVWRNSRYWLLPGHFSHLNQHP